MSNGHAAADATPAVARLQAAVSDLTRARKRQIFIETGWKALFCGLLAACIAVLVVRVTDLAYPPWRVAGSLLLLSLAAAVAIAWRRRPDDLHAAILADLQLKLNQRLSTAWEFTRSGTDPAVAERLAKQAVKTRLPGLRVARL